MREQVDAAVVPVSKAVGAGGVVTAVLQKLSLIPLCDWTTYLAFFGAALYVVGMIYDRWRKHRKSRLEHQAAEFDRQAAELRLREAELRYQEALEDVDS